MRDIIDNQESYLADAVRPLLNQFVRAHVAVGCFFLSGLDVIAAELKKLKELRLLVVHASREPRNNIELNAISHGIGNPSSTYAR